MRHTISIPTRSDGQHFRCYPSADFSRTQYPGLPMRSNSNNPSTPYYSRTQQSDKPCLEEKKLELQRFCRVTECPIGDPIPRTFGLSFALASLGRCLHRRIWADQF